MTYEHEFQALKERGAALVFIASLNRFKDKQPLLLKTLSEIERTRAGAFRFEKDSDMFVLGRGLMRVLLGEYLNKDPSELQFNEGEYGKLSLSSGEVEFNLSHSKELAVFAFCREGAVGVDVEWSGRRVEYDDIARRFFSAGEYEAFAALPEEDKRLAFYNIWTRKEAFIKAIGDGLSFPLSEFQVSIGPTASLLETSWDSNARHEWSLHSLDLPTEYIGAIAGKAEIERVDLYELDSDRLF